MTPNMQRTIAAFEAAGLEAKRIRETDQYGMPAQQVFFRPAGSILELIGPKDPIEGDDRPARFFGLAFTSKDLDLTAKAWGDRLHPAKEAVQPGRKIATLDKSAGSTTAIAVMSRDFRSSRLLDRYAIRSPGGPLGPMSQHPSIVQPDVSSIPIPTKATTTASPTTSARTSSRRASSTGTPVQSAVRQGLGARP